MPERVKNKQEILEKLRIAELNPMQQKAEETILSSREVVLLSPTGTGKTLAFLLPVVRELEESSPEVQVLILVPSRELAIQIEQVTREMGSGFKANAVYGGRAFSKDKAELAHPPSILIGTPGRVADHLRRETFSVQDIRVLILDEFDKSLETGFESEMAEIFEALPNVQKKIFTSATRKTAIPGFARVKDPVVLDYLENADSQLQVKTILSQEKDKYGALLKLLAYTGNQRGIIFCNFKDTIEDLSDFLNKNRIEHGCFYGGMEQKERERALIKFRNETHRLLLATDLAARGIDVPELDFIVHYQLPLKEEEFVHRNGRTARMQKGGTAYVLQWKKEELPEFIDPGTVWKSFEELDEKKVSRKTGWETLFISGGRKDKISKGDIAGLFLKQGNLKSESLGNIELKQDCAFVSVPSEEVHRLIRELNNTRLKRKTVRIYQV